MTCMEIVTAALWIAQLLYVDGKWFNSGVDKVETYTGRTFY